MYNLSVPHVRRAVKILISLFSKIYNAFYMSIVLSNSKSKKGKECTVLCCAVKVLVYLLVAADSTPLGDQDILYLKGFSAATGSGRPPHRDTSSVTLPPLS